MIKVNKLRGLIVEQYGTLTNYANFINTSINSLSCILNKKNKPNFELLKKFNDSLNLSPDEFVDIFFSQQV